MSLTNEQEIINFTKRIKAMKVLYEKLLSPFFMVDEVRKYRKMIYSLELSEGQKNKIWEYLNSDISINYLIFYLGGKANERSHETND